MKHTLSSFRRSSALRVLSILILALMCAPLAMAAAFAPAAPTLALGGVGFGTFAAVGGIAGLGLLAAAGGEGQENGGGGAADEKPLDPATALAQGMDEKLTIKQRLSAMASALKGIPPAEQFTKVSADLTASQAEVTRLTAELTTTKATLAAREKDLENLDKEKITIATERDALKAKEQDIDKRADAKAREKVSALGFPAANLVPTTEQTAALATTYAEAIEAYGKIKDPQAAAAYYAATIVPMLSNRK